DLLAIQNKVSVADHLKKIGETVEVLVEGPSKAASGLAGSGPIQLTGRTMTDHIAVFDGNPRLIGKTVSVHVEEATAFTLFGTVLTGEQVGVSDECCEAPPAKAQAAGNGRIGLPLV